MGVGADRWAAGLSATALVAASALAVAPGASAAPSRAAPAVSAQTEWTFSYTGAPQLWTVPSGLTKLTMRVVGGAGAYPNDEVGRGGVSGMVIADFAVTPGEQLTVWVGQGGESSNGDGGWGWGCGGTHGTARVSAGRDGGAGGGASAVSSGAFTTSSLDCTHRPVNTDLLAVAGGGGGGGGDGFGVPFSRTTTCVPQAGGRGGDAGKPASSGGNGQSPQCGAVNNGGAGAASANANGHNGHDGGFLGGAGGGGGGGYRGGDSGGGQDDASGGGGGGGSSFVASSATTTYFLPGNGAGDGTVVLTSGVTEVFTCTGNQVQGQVPAGMGRMAMTVVGGQGGGTGGDIAQGGSGGVLTVDATVTPGDYFTVYVGCYGGGHGGFGFLPGGDHGLAPDPAPKDGGGGGGASAVVYDGAQPSGNEGLIVAGGGGGGGGEGAGFDNTTYGYAPGGQGGNAGTVTPLKGRSASFTGGGGGGCYGCEPVYAPGARGENASRGSEGGGGGGGGGGYSGGGGGGGGDLGLIGGAGGGGGGGGSSYLSWGSQSTLQNLTQGTTDLTGDGLVILQFTPGTGSVSAYGGSKQRVVVGRPFTAPLAALVSDRAGLPVADTPVTFDLAPNGGPAYGTFPGGKTTAVAVTHLDGVATSPPITATTRIGAWEPQASVPGLAAAARFQLYNDKYPVHLSPGVTPNPATTLRAMHFTVTARAPSGTPVPTGQVQFYIDDHLDATATLSSDGTATVLYDPFAYQVGPGNHTLRTSYGGDATHAASNASTPFTVDQIATAVTVTSSKNPSDTGEPITFTASVATTDGAPTPTGQVTFAVDGTTFDTVTLGADGTATSKQDTGLSTGAHVITATFPGDTDYAASHGTLEQQVGKSSSGTFPAPPPNPVVAGELTTWIARVAAESDTVQTPSGTVRWETAAGTSPSADAPLAGGNGLALGQVFLRLPQGSANVSQSYDMVVTYSGDANFGPSEGRFTQTWVKAPVTVTVTHNDPPVHGGTSTLFAQIKPPASAQTPSGLGLSGTVQFAVDGVAVGTPSLVSPQGVAALGGVKLPGGWSTIRATYSGNQWLSTGAGSSDSLLQTAPTTISLDAGRNPMGHADSTRLTAAIANTATAGDSPVGAVQFRVDGLDFGDPVPVVNGTATSAPLGPLTSGRHNTEAIFVPASRTDYTGSRDTLTADVLFATTTTVGTPHTLLQAGATVTVTAQITPIPLTGSTLADAAPIGTVQFTMAGATLSGCQAVAVRNGRADCTVSRPALSQTSVIHAAYSGSGLYAPSQGDTTQEVTAGLHTDNLPNTGAPVRGLALLGALFLAAGGALTLFARRWRHG